MTPDSGRAGRAVGAMIFATFGAVWLEAWVWFSQRDQWWRYLVIAVVAVGLVGAALRLYRGNRAVVSETAVTDTQRRNSRLFHFINIGQWVLILIGVNVLNNTGRSAWDIPFIMLVIGAHFLPLAHLFKRPTHYVTGAAMVLFALSYPFVTGNPQSAVGPLGAGLILWISAAWALFAGFRSA